MNDLSVKTGLSAWGNREHTVAQLVGVHKHEGERDCEGDHEAHHGLSAASVQFTAANSRVDVL